MKILRRSTVVFSFLLLVLAIGCAHSQSSTSNSLAAGQFEVQRNLDKLHLENGHQLNLTMGFGSGAYHRTGDPDNIFYTITDRGPNLDCDERIQTMEKKDLCDPHHTNGKFFPQPDFAPAIVKHEISNQNGRLSVRQLEVITLKDKSGKKITGLPNHLTSAQTEEAFGPDGRPLPWDNGGVDPEAIVRLKDGTYWLAEEYGPSLIHVDDDGTVLQRVVPDSVAADLADSGYPVDGGLPDIYKTRQLNRGIESIAVSPDETALYFIMQSPLANPDASAFKSSRIIRLMKFGLKSGNLGKALGEYTYVLDTPQTYCDLTGTSLKGDHTNGSACSQSDVKVSDMLAVGEDDLIILERISKVTKLYRVHLKTGDNIINTTLSSSGTREAGAAKTLEQLWDLSSAGASPLRKVLVYNSLTDNEGTMPLPPKVEGMARLNDQFLLMINDNDFGIGGQKTIAAVLPIGSRLSGEKTRADQLLKMSLIGRYSSGHFDRGASEIVAYHVGSKRIFVVNSEDKRVDILDAGRLTSHEMTNPLSTTNLKKIGDIDIRMADKHKKLGAANSLAIHNDLLAVAVEAADELGNKKQGRGIVAFFDIKQNPHFIKSIEVGCLPDMVTFSPDGGKVLVANEGEPNNQYNVDPAGSLSLIEIRNGRPVSPAIEMGFENSPMVGDVRIYGPSKEIGPNLEPEYIAVSKDSQRAYVSLQENNALALVDLTVPVISRIVGLGVKDYGAAGNELDVSDKDDRIDLASYPGLCGLYQPDSIAVYSFHHQDYLVSANEGDARDYWFDAASRSQCKQLGGHEFDEENGCLAYSEETRVAKLKLNSGHPALKLARDKTSLGRLKTTTEGGDINGDGKKEKIYTYGGRSFSIWNQTGQLVFDSMADFEKITAGRLGENFNSNNTENGGESRSDDKGPEPEALAVGEVNGRMLAFIGLERTGGIMMYDITSPFAPQFLQYTNNRNFKISIEDNLAQAGDLAPEGFHFVPAEKSPTAHALLIVGNEVSGSTSVYEVR